MQHNFWRNFNLFLIFSYNLSFPSMFHYIALIYREL